MPEIYPYLSKVMVWQWRGEFPSAGVYPSHMVRIVSLNMKELIYPHQRVKIWRSLWDCKYDIVARQETYLMRHDDHKLKQKQYPLGFHSLVHATHNPLDLFFPKSLQFTLEQAKKLKWADI